jgi:excinuclease UvrABC ATPase subunit
MSQLGLALGPRVEEDDEEPTDVSAGLRVMSRCRPCQGSGGLVISLDPRPVRSVCVVCRGRGFLTVTIVGKERRIRVR